MNKQVTRMNKNKFIYRNSIAAFSLLCIFVCFLCFQYYQRLQQTIKAETHGYMQEISEQMAANVSKVIENKYAVLGTLAAVFDHVDVATYEQLQSISQEQQSLWHFQKLFLIDQSGVAYNDDGSTVMLSSDRYLQDVVVKKEASFTTSQIIDGKESIVFAIPIQNVHIGGTEMLALAISYELSTFDQIISMSAFDGKGYAHIIRHDGTVVVRSSSPNSLPTGFSILNSLSKATLFDNQTIEQIKADIQAEKDGQVEFVLGKAHEHMTYTPLGSTKWTLLTFVPVEVVNAKSSIMLKITLLLGAFITFAFAILLAVLILTFQKNRHKLERIAYVDPVTGGHTIEYFYEQAEHLLSDSHGATYALIYTNIEKFKVLNVQFGRNACDEILCSLQNGISTDLTDAECMGRLFADNFCILVQYNSEAELEKRLELWCKNGTDYVLNKGKPWLPLILEFGVYIVDDPSLPFPQMIDCAKLALSEAAGGFHAKVRYAIYDEQARRKLFREKQLEDRMDSALESSEFQVYLQPKYCTQTEQVGGAEALARWISPSDGLIFPDEFIPLFEKNGFVIQLDFYVFREVCKAIRKWLDNGIEPVKVSVNCSRLHLKNMDFLKTYCTIADQFEVAHRYLEIELTENTVFDDVAGLSAIIKEIHAAGFGCSMDDFGSGYSSLNLIRDIPVDTLKLDKVFFLSKGDLQRSESVIGSIITMSKHLSMTTVAEGVEERSQVDMLQRLGCDYIQGYFFAKPMPISEFEQLAFGRPL
ncbi:MAG: EAL domain-containing protein [Clostridia bacterium]